MQQTSTATLLVVATLVLASTSGVGLVAAEDLPSATDGKVANGEELKTAQDKDDQVYQINYTFRLQNHQPGNKDGAVRHYAVGLTENGTLYRIKLYSEAFGFSNCEPSNTAAFGIDRNNDESGTTTDKSLLTAFKSYNSQANYIDIKFYRKETLAGQPVTGDVNDQIVAAQNSCYDNPSKPGWYRINGTITGHNAGTSGTDTNYKIRDLSQWVYVCDCSSRAEAEQKLGPPPGEGGDSTPTATPSSGGDSTPTATATATPSSGDSTPTATPSNSGGNGPQTTTATPSSGGDSSPTTTPSNGGGDGTPTTTATATGTSTGGAGNATSTVTATATSGDGQSGGTTPTAGSGPGFGVVAALGGLSVAGLLARRRG